MKKFSVILIVLTAFTFSAALAACASSGDNITQPCCGVQQNVTDKQNLIDQQDCSDQQGCSDQQSCSMDIPFGDVQYIRIGSGFGPVNPAHTVIHSLNELNQYTASINNGSFWDDVYKNAIEKYSGSFFANNFLVIILLEEISGSNRHKVERIDINGDIIIKRLIPEIGTSDMATWNIIIELDNNFKADTFQVLLN